MVIYLLDNNIISKYFSSSFNSTAQEFVSDVLDQIPNISVITQIETLSWVNADKKIEKIAQNFILDSNIYGLNADIIHRCIKIRRNKKSIKIPDAIIAATAISNEMTLISTDADFKGIQGLKLINPLDL